MSEAIKTGDKVTINGGDGAPVEVIDVVTLYYVNTYPTPMALRESQIRPYVRPLAVGDRVRHKYAEYEGVIDAIRGPKASVWACGQWNVWAIANIERIPEEAGK